MTFEGQVHFLTQALGADKVRHSGRTLFKHLHGTYALLERWGASEHVKLGGLFHSVYGTNAFKHACLDASSRRDRERVRDVIGQQAERLTYVFCVVNRPQAFLEVADFELPVLWDHVKRERLSVTKSELLDLMEIEAANLLEQGSTGRAIIRLIPYVSEPAKQALQEIIEAQRLSVLRANNKRRGIISA